MRNALMSSCNFLDSSVTLGVPLLAVLLPLGGFLLAFPSLPRSWLRLATVASKDSPTAFFEAAPVTRPEVEVFVPARVMSVPEVGQYTGKYDVSGSCIPICNIQMGNCS